MSQHRHKWYKTHRCLNCIYQRAGSITLFRGLGGAFWIASLVAVACLGLLKYINEPGKNDLPKWLQIVVTFIHDHALTIAVILILIQLVSGILHSVFAKTVSNKDLSRTKIKKVLNTLVAGMFENRDAQYAYRATLFKVRRCWFFGSWLGIVQRSGHLFPTHTTIFSINHQSREHCTGVAGQCWWRAEATGKGLLLLDIEDGQCQTEGEYADRGFVDDKELRAIGVRSKHFCAIDIKVHGRTWGILVVDSTDTNYAGSAQSPNSQSRKSLDQAAQMITLLIE